MKNHYVILKTFMILFLLTASGWIFNTFSQDTWTKLKDMPTARSKAGSCLLDGKIYVMGGGSGTDPASWYATTEAYDIELDKWTVLANMHVKRYGATYHVINNKIYAFGGKDEGAVEVYDPQEDVWTLKGSMPEDRWNHASCVYNNKVYFFGGGDIYRVYDPASDTWQTIFENWGWGSSSCCVFNNKIYVFGGEGAALNKLDTYDPGSDTWEELADIPEKTFGHITLLYNNKILLFGGDNGSHDDFPDEINPLNHLFEYDPANDKWKRLIDMPFSRSFMTGVTSGNYVYLFGGYEQPGGDYPLAEAWRCDPEYVFITNAAFLSSLIKEGVDTDGDGLISYDEAEEVTSLDLTGCEATDLKGIEAFVEIDSLVLDFTPFLKKLDLSRNTKLRYLSIDNWTYDGSSLTSLIVPNNAELEYLCCRGNNLSDLDISNCSNFKHLDVSHNKFTNLNLPYFSSLEYLNCGWNQLTNLDVTMSPYLQKLICSTNQLSSSLNLYFNDFIKDLDISYMPGLIKVCISDQVLNNANIDTRGSSNVNFSNNYKEVIVNIPDTLFLSALIEKGVDTNGDSMLSYGEAEEITSLDVSGTFEIQEIHDMTGIEALINLDSLSCNHTNITELNLSNNRNLKFLSCHDARDPCGGWWGCCWKKSDISPPDNYSKLSYPPASGKLETLNISKSLKLCYSKHPDWLIHYLRDPNSLRHCYLKHPGWLIHFLRSSKFLRQYSLKYPGCLMD